MADGHDSYASHSCMLFLSSSYLVLSSRLPFTSAIVLLAYIAFCVGEDWKAVYGREYIWIEFVCVRDFFVPFIVLVFVLFLIFGRVLFIIKESILKHISNNKKKNLY
jgi:hypothetical protein